MKISLNDYVYVKLTEFGKKNLFNYWLAIFNGYENKAIEAIEMYDLENSNYKRFQLHNFMTIFGNHIDLGNQNFCFENNEIFTNLKDLK